MVADKKYEVVVSSQTQYVAEQSDEQNGRYVFAYTMTIRNTGSIPAQLISRRWIITDGRNQVQEVRGLGGRIVLTGSFPSAVAALRLARQSPPHDKREERERHSRFEQEDPQSGAHVAILSRNNG